MSYPKNNGGMNHEHQISYTRAEGMNSRHSKAKVFEKVRF